MKTGGNLASGDKWSILMEKEKWKDIPEQPSKEERLRRLCTRSMSRLASIEQEIPWEIRLHSKSG